MMGSCVAIAAGRISDQAGICLEPLASARLYDYLRAAAHSPACAAIPVHGFNLLLSIAPFQYAGALNSCIRWS